jgi:hypothetical protein
MEAAGSPSALRAIPTPSLSVWLERLVALKDVAALIGGPSLSCLTAMALDIRATALAPQGARSIEHHPLHLGLCADSHQQLPHHRFTHGVTRATHAAHPLIGEEVLQQQPTEFVGEFKGLDQPLLLQFTEGALAGRGHSALQCCEGAAVIVEPLQPAHICFCHGCGLDVS